MDAEDLPFNNCPNAKVVEDLSAVFPRVSISIFPNSLIVEAVNGRNLSCLMISSEESNVGGVLQLQAKEQLEGLNRVVASVDKVPHEDVPRVGDFASLIK